MQLAAEKISPRKPMVISLHAFPSLSLSLSLSQGKRGPFFSETHYIHSLIYWFGKDRNTENRKTDGLTAFGSERHKWKRGGWCIVKALGLSSPLMFSVLCGCLRKHVSHGRRAVRHAGRLGRHWCVPRMATGADTHLLTGVKGGLGGCDTHKATSRANQEPVWGPCGAASRS